MGDHHPEKKGQEAIAQMLLVCFFFLIYIRKEPLTLDLLNQNLSFNKVSGGSPAN